MAELATSLRVQNWIHSTAGASCPAKTFRRTSVPHLSIWAQPRYIGLNMGEEYWVYSDFKGACRSPGSWQNDTAWNLLLGRNREAVGEAGSYGAVLHVTQKDSCPCKHYYKVMWLNPPPKGSKLTNFKSLSWSLLWWAWVFIGYVRKAASLSHLSLMKCYSTSRAATTPLWQIKPNKWTKILQVCSKPG